MASTFTSRIRLNKQGDGDNPNSWGVSTQNELIEIFATNNKDSWTIIFTNTNGLSCGLVGGEQGLIFK